MLGVFWNPQDLLLLMGTEIYKIDASWAEKLMKTRVSKIMAPTVMPTCHYTFKLARHDLPGAQIFNIRHFG